VQTVMRSPTLPDSAMAVALSYGFQAKYLVPHSSELARYMYSESTFVHANHWPVTNDHRRLFKTLSVFTQLGPGLVNRRQCQTRITSKTQWNEERSLLWRGCLIRRWDCTGDEKQYWKFIPASAAESRLGSYTYPSLECVSR
jgi:hypothetical protein